MTREERTKKISDAIAGIPATMTRDEYERFIATYCPEVEPLSEEQIKRGSYRNGDYGFSDDPSGAWHIRQIASMRRESGMKAETRTTAPPTSSLVACPNCGAMVGRASLMNAAVGQSCPNCYDELS